MKKENYYAIVNYRGKQKYYYVSASEENPKGETDIRVEYIDYNPNREWPGVWILRGQDKIIQKFDDKSNEYKYFKKLDKKWDRLCLEHAKSSQKYYKEDKIDMCIGTSNIFKYWKQAVRETSNPLNIIL